MSTKTRSVDEILTEIATLEGELATLAGHACRYPTPPEGGECWSCHLPSDRPAGSLCSRCARNARYDAMAAP